MSLTFGSWCSGIEAASEAWLPIGWSCAYVAEIEPFPCSYLAQTYGAGRPRYMPRPEDADTPVEAKRRSGIIRTMDRRSWGADLVNFGDLSQVSAAELPRVDILGAGFPCQDFSIAGLRASLGGKRGSLSTIGVRLLLEAADLGLVRGAVLEQVPDVLNTPDNAWGNILGALVGADAALEGLDHGGKWPRAGMVAGPRARVAWRILDAQHFGLAQRRERVWAVVDFGDGPDPAAVLFERKGVFGDHAPRVETGQGVTHDLAPSITASGRGYSRTGESRGQDPVIDGDDGTQRRAAFGGNNTSGPIDVATARTASHTASHTASGRQDFESETFVCETAPSLTAQLGEQTGQDAKNGLLVAHSLRGEGFDASEDGTGRGTPLVPVAYSIMPQNSGKDYKAPEVDVAQPVMAAGPAGGNQGGDYIVQPIAFSCKDYGADAGPQSRTLRAMGHAGSHANAGGQVAVAFSLRGREGGAMPECEEGDLSPAIRAAEGGSTRPFVAMSQATEYNSHHADAEKTRPIEALRALREAVGAAAAEEWGLGVLASFWPPEILRPDLHGGSVRRTTEQEHGVVNGALPLAQDGGEGAVREVREAGRQRRAPRGWQPSEQHALELGAYLSELSQQGASPEGVVHDLRRAGYRARLLQQALHQVQEARRSAGGLPSTTNNMQSLSVPGALTRPVRKASAAGAAGNLGPNSENPERSGQGGVGDPPFAVRRITVVEAEILQGFPPNATLIDWPSANRKGEDLAETVAYLIGHGFTPERAFELAQTPDGPRYKAIGNSWPVPVARWIGERIAAVMLRQARAA